MTETTEVVAGSRAAKGGLTGMKLAELKDVASGLGLTGTTRMRKDELVAAISARQGGSSATREHARTDRAPQSSADRAPAPGGDAPAQNDQRGTANGAGSGTAAGAQGTGGQHRRAGAPQGVPQGAPQGAAQGDRAQAAERGEDRAQGDRAQGDRAQGDRAQDRGQGDRGQGDRGQGDRGQGDRGQAAERTDRERNQGQQRYGQQGQGQQGQGRYDDDGDGRGRRRSRQRSRDRKRGRGQQGGLPMGQDVAEPDVTIADDDVLVPVAGILDVLDNYAFVRTSGYLPGPGDVYVPLGMVRRHGLRKGDAVTGAVRAVREGEAPTGPSGNRTKFNPLVRLDTVYGDHPDVAKTRVEFAKLTPLYPQERLRLETASNIITTRVVDLVSPIGKGQRGLIVSPPKAGKTLILQAIANAITTNNPEVHLMVVLVDERPEEVTDMQRTVRGEVIASTFDRPADDHTTVAELAIERAKRLVELGHDVVVLLDGITRLGRAYNLAAPASGRILSGGVDSAALYPPKKFFGAARNIENGGSLTILATALVETGSKMDEVIFEEFKGTGNWELKLSRQLANRRIFPAVDVNASGTRREDILMSPEELKIMWKLRRVLSALDETQGIELLLDRLKKTKSNLEFLVQVQRTSSIKLDDEDD